VLGEESKVTRHQNVIIQCVKKVLNERREKIRSNDDASCLLDALLAYEDLCDEKIASTVAGFILMGFDRLASTTCFALLELSKQFEVQMKISREIDGNVQIASLEAVKSMKVLENFLLETQRLYPATSVVSKWITEGIALNGYFVPQNTSVLLYLNGTGRDYQRFNNPDQFDVTRKNLAETFGSNQTDFDVPMAVMKVLVGNLLKKYQMRMEKNSNVVIGSGNTLRLNGIKVNVRTR
jgi:cytochrome P450